MTDLHEPEQVVRQLFDAFRRGDLDELAGTLSPEVRWTYIGANPTPVKALLVGRDRVRAFFAGILRRLDMSSFEPAQIFVQGGTVIVFGRESGTLKSSGKPFHNEWVQKYVVDAGLVSEMVEYNVEVPPRRAGATGTD